MELLEGIKNIIFDFGGVVINIDYSRTEDAFRKLGITRFDEVYNQFRQTSVFDRFETGRIDGQEFFNEIKKLVPPGVPEKKLRDAWNAMLLDFPEEHFNLLSELKRSYRTFLLSNTNEPHLEYYFGNIKSWYGLENMDPLFEKTYYSCRLGMRKPDTEIFEFVLKDSGLLPSETLFIDDSPQHLEGAGKCGIRVFHMKKPETIISLFSTGLSG